MLLSYLKYLRIIVSIINIALYNWSKAKIKIIINNNIFIINLIRLPEK